MLQLQQICKHIAKSVPSLNSKKATPTRPRRNQYVCGYVLSHQQQHDKCSRQDLRICFTPTLEDAWYKQEFYASSKGKERWLADTGATTHITMNDHNMTNVENVNVTVIVGDGKEVICMKRGDILISNGESKMLLQQVLYTPNFHQNIVSIGQFARRGGSEVLMRGSTLRLRKEASTHELTFKCNSNSVLYYYKGLSTHSIEGHCHGQQ